ncbi:50S ribosomal protein L37e [Methanosalsum natronophilum]|uniref:Large ribosomal subunit protein eL37 n=1 Tax=Methanosalsum natronophilum TaxID=768733 RepID=A0A3R7VUW2_9EURY|nr:50S ribosomal protein L37e [Methanosalsum natronophilum]MCS3923312.1 large subunit ribosomal protein L37e [Methanosalsum natronophilum]RQD89551.1 MAG: 50S ribosomal protein L37e [Methanosalsum natronophilum]
MTKGTPSKGKRQKRTHAKCRRCGSVSRNIHTKICTSCGFGKSSRMRKYSWSK